MKNYTLSLTMLALLLVILFTGCSQQGSQAAGSDEKVTLQLNPEAGQTFKLVQKMDQDISTKIMGMSQDMKQEMEFFLKYDVVAPSEESVEMKITYDRIKYKIESAMFGVMTDYDSDDPDGGGGNPMSKVMTESFSGLIGKSITAVMDRKGKITEIKGLDDLYDDIDGELPPNLNAEGLEKTMQGMIAIFPDVQVGVGDTWGSQNDLSGQFPLIMTTTYKVENIDANTVYLNVEGEIETTDDAVDPDSGGKITMEGSQEGIMEVDRATGMVLKADYTQEITGEVEAGPVKAPMEIESRITIDSYE